MKTFRELYVKVDSLNTAKFIAAVDAVLSEGWTRKIEDKSLFSDAIGGEHIYYVCDRRDSREAALLAIYRKDDTTLYVSNIVPRESGQLTHDQYNEILMNFHDSILRKLATDFPVTVLALGDQRKIEDLMSPSTLKKLRSFAGLANKSTGSAHPMDRDRWYGFLLAIGAEDAALTGHDLLRWLVEVDDWPERTAHDLVSEFEFALGFLKRIKGQNPPNAGGERGGSYGRRV